MCKWYCTSEGPSTNLKCKSCGCHYCAACLHGDAGKMQSLTKCARCGKKPTVVPAGQNASWQCITAAPTNTDFSAQRLEASAGGHFRVAGVSSNMQDYSSMCRTPDAPARQSRSRAASGGCVRASTPPNASRHPDQVDRVKMQCPVCGYRSFPQWMNNQAHCLKCDAVLKTRPSCQERPSSRGRVRSVTRPEALAESAPDSPIHLPRLSTPTSTPKTSVHPDQVDRVKLECHVCGYKSFPQWMNDKAHCLKCEAVLKARPSCHEGHSCATHGNATNLDDSPTADLPNLLIGNSKNPLRSSGRQQIKGPERFFYDKSSYTGTHARGGPAHVPKGMGSRPGQFWTRPGA
mmetsp:Transcript_118059/g.204012  ORF Transcript_118059/g.204012 Transcript_118059/m.204012 type:complete len:347 (+) Transcript_118059:59-1099(+)